MELPRRWERVETFGENYTPRTGHTVSVVANRFYLFAGADVEIRTNDLYCFDPQNKSWTQLMISENMPHERSGAQSVSKQNKKIYFFGGYTRKGGEYFNDLFAFDIDTYIWSYLQPTTSEMPDKRTDHVFETYKENFYLYGGRDECHIISDLYKFSLATQEWICLGKDLEEPRMRFGHSGVVHQQFLYIFGGWDGIATLSDLVMFDMEQERWTLLTVSG